MSIDINTLTNSKCTTTLARDRHKATVQVGRDTIEAEYFAFEHFDFLKLKEESKLEKFWDIITTPYYKVKYIIDKAYWSCRHGFQRMFKGYDSVDTFETFAKFVERYEKILIELRNHHWGHPGDLTEDEWNNILDEMIYHLHYMDEDNLREEFEKDVPDDWTVSLQTLSNVIEMHKDEFFKLFSEHFFSLWD